MMIWDDRMKASVYGDDVKKAEDGTYTVFLSPWCDEPIYGIPTRKLALHIVYVAHEAMRSYADNAMTD